MDPYLLMSLLGGALVGYNVRRMSHDNWRANLGVIVGCALVISSIIQAIMP